MFVNFTNHKSAGWSSEQLVAAEEWGEVTDLPFPNVPPEFSAEEVSRLAEEYLSKITKLKPDAVLVQGEMTLAFAVAAGLKKNGITPLCASTERICETVQGENGATVTRSVFKFVRFREYRF